MSNRRDRPGPAPLLAAGAGLLTILLHLGAGALGPAGIVLYLLIPLPAAYVQMRSGLAAGLAAIGMAAGGALIVVDPAAAVLYLVQFGTVSLMLPLLLRRGWAWDRAVAATLGLLAVVALVVLAGISMQQGLSPLALMDRYIAGEVASVTELYSQLEVPAEQRADYQALVERMGQLLRTGWPGLALTVTGALLLFQVLLLNRLSNGRYGVPGPEFRNWKAPEPLIWLLIATGFGALFAEGAVGIVALNGLVILLPVYFLQGLAVTSHFFWRKGVSPLVRSLGYVLIAILNPLPLVVTGIGVFDLWINFRKPKIKESR